MKKKAAKKKAVAKKKSAARPVKRATSKPARIQLKKDSTSKVAAPLADEGKLTFNHAMIYVKDVERGMNFYRD